MQNVDDMSMGSKCLKLLAIFFMEFYSALHAEIVLTQEYNINIMFKTADNAPINGKC